LGKIININEISPYEIYPLSFERGIQAPTESGVFYPQIEPGSQEIKVQVNIIFEIK
jgi:uncharacterized protein YggE